MPPPAPPRWPELGGQRADAGERRLEVVRDAAQEVGLDGGEPVELIGLAPDAGVEERVLERGAGMLADQAQKVELGRRGLGRPSHGA